MTDASGSSVPGATVTLTSPATSQRRVAQSSQDGNYEFVNLIPGRYNVEVEKTGFKRITRNDIEVQVQAAVRVDTALQVGDVGQTIEVTAQLRCFKPKRPPWAPLSISEKSRRCHSTAGT